MRLDDLLKKLNLKRKEGSDEVVFNEEADNTAENEVKDTLKEAVPVEKEENKEEVKKMAVPKYDTQSGLFSLDGIEDAELKAVLKLANDTVRANANSALIAKAIDTKIGSIKLADGISSDVILAVLDRSNIKVTDGKVSGVDEAFEALKTNNAGLFAKENKESNPVLEGFNPVPVTNTGRVPNSFAEALAMEQGNV